VSYHLGLGSLSGRHESKIDVFACANVSYRGHELRKKLSDKPVLNANVLNYLLKHPNLIPEDWKDEYTLFFGTVYNFGGRLFVLSLYWTGGVWHWYHHWLNRNLNDCNPSVLLAS